MYTTLSLPTSSFWSLTVLHTASDQKPEPEKAWEWGYTTLTFNRVNNIIFVKNQWTWKSPKLKGEMNNNPPTACMYCRADIIHYPRSQALRVHHLQYKIRAEFHTASDEHARPGNEANKYTLCLSTGDACILLHTYCKLPKYPHGWMCVLFCSFLLGLHVYHLFGLLWVGNYVLALGECTLAGGFASWYWAYKKPRVR